MNRFLRRLEGVIVSKGSDYRQRWYFQSLLLLFLRRCLLLVQVVDSNRSYRLHLKAFLDFHEVVDKVGEGHKSPCFCHFVPFLTTASEIACDLVRGNYLHVEVEAPLQENPVD